MKVTVTGASDDLIEVEGDIREEFNVGYRDDDQWRYLAFSDGTLLRVEYDKDGIWRVRRVMKGSATYSLVDGDVESDANDVATLEGDNLRWALMGSDMARGKETACARKLGTFDRQSRLDDSTASDDAKHYARELGIAVFLYDSYVETS